MIGASDTYTPFDLQMGFSRSDLFAFLRHCHDSKVSDITMSSGDFIWGRWNRTYVALNTRRLDHEEVAMAIHLLYGASGLARLEASEDLDWRVSAQASRDDAVHFRGNATSTRVSGIARGIQITMRPIPDLPPKLAALGIEDEITQNLFPRYGLILVVGTTGSGKSTLLMASMRERLENRRHDPVKILTFEDPIEYTLEGLAGGHMPEPSQVEIGDQGNLISFARATRNAMRRSGDVIIAGEMRDSETVNAGFELAMTGHAVMSTLHVDTPAEVFDRIVSFFPVDGQPAAANKLLSVSRMFVAQKLARTKLGKVMAFRSWLVLDEDVKRELSARPYHEWAAMTRDRLCRAGTDFATQALKAYRDGHLTWDVFKEVGGLTEHDARAAISAADSQEGVRHG